MEYGKTCCDYLPGEPRSPGLFVDLIRHSRHQVKHSEGFNDGYPHINAEMGDFADVVLMLGDLLRAKHIAETFLKMSAK